jgi:hypothetical protein
MSNKIQPSQTTAELLIGAGKAHWLTPREDAVEAKGKGALTPFWVYPQKMEESSESSFATPIKK